MARISNRTFPIHAHGALRLTLVVLLSCAASGCAAPGIEKDPAASVDLLITGGEVFDGSNSPGRRVDVAITGDRIVAVAPDLGNRYRATRVIDASGLVVAPGFIDPHTHPDSYIRHQHAAVRRNLPWLYQGVTTIFIGVDGGGTPEVAQERAWFDSHGVGTNVAAYVGLGPVRRRVLGNDARAPDTQELAQMRALVAQAMCEGAFGLSTGLFYTPQGFATTDEVVALAREAGRRGGRYDSHLRDESSYSIGLLASIDEALEIGRRAELPVHIAHIKALGADVHGQSEEVIARIERAQAQGQAITADHYPWLASSTGLDSVLLPAWARDGGRAALFARLEEPATAQRIRDEMRNNLRRRGGAAALLMVGEGWPWTGRSLAQMAATWEQDPVDAALRIIRTGGVESRGARGALRVASFNMIRDDVVAFMRRPWVLTGSDGSDGHPRQHATFPEKYARFVVEDQVITLQDFIHRSTGLTADTLGLADRGYLRQGYHADVVVFDPLRYAPRATYENPTALAEGVVHVFVNGTAMLGPGHASAALPGRMLLHRPPQGTCP